jgi:transcription elongation factor Elf1
MKSYKYETLNSLGIIVYEFNFRGIDSQLYNKLKKTEFSNNNTYVRVSIIIPDGLRYYDYYPVQLLNKFYLSSYGCPICGHTLYKTILRSGLRINTNEGNIYIERIFTCPDCTTFYASKSYETLDSGHSSVLSLDRHKYKT